MKLTVAEGVTEILYRAGVKRIYGIVGTSILPAVNALKKFSDKIRYFSCRHEQVSASMADAEGRITGAPGVVLVHAAPGSLNAAISVANAYKDASPMIMIAGTASSREKGRDGFLDLPLKEVFGFFTLASYRIDNPSRLADTLCTAYRKAISVPVGPVFIEVSENIWKSETEFDENTLNFKPDPLPRAKDEDIRKGKAMLDNSVRPVILSGRGVSLSGAQAELRKFAEAYNIPVITTGNGRGTMPEDHHLCLGRSGYAGGNTAADYAFINADLVLAIGCTVSDLTDYNRTWNPTGEVLVVNPYKRANDDARARKFIPVQCDAKSFLNAFLKVPPGELLPKKDEWLKALDAKKEEWKNMLLSSTERDSPIVPPGKVLKLLRSLLQRDSFISAGAGLHLVYANDFIECYEPDTYLATNNFGSMGFGLAAALAAKAIFPQRQAVAILGDGEFMMTLQDLELAVRENLAVKIVILNDNSYRVLRMAQVIDGLEPYGTEHTNPDFLKLAEAFNIKAFRITKENMESALKEFLSSSGPAILEIPTDRDDLPPTNIDAVMKMRNLAGA